MFLLTKLFSHRVKCTATCNLFSKVAQFFFAHVHLGRFARHLKKEEKEGGIKIYINQDISGLFISICVSYLYKTKIEILLSPSTLFFYSNCTVVVFFFWKKTRTTTTGTEPLPCKIPSYSYFYKFLLLYLHYSLPINTTTPPHIWNIQAYSELRKPQCRWPTSHKVANFLYAFRGNGPSHFWARFFRGIPPPLNRSKK
jgi:hypothetical protein